MREQLLSGILSFLSGQDLLAREDICAALEREIDRAGANGLVELGQRLKMDHGWNYYPPDPLARRIHHLLADRFLQRDSKLIDGEYLSQVEAAPVVIFANHLSYADANVVEVLLQQSRGATLADRLTAIAGPKVFISRQRRFSSLCFGTVKVPQSAEVSSDEAVLPPREVARAARQAIDVARGRLASGDALLLFAEGTRSRSGGMKSLLVGAARYLECSDPWILPVGLTGPEALFPIEAQTVQPARVVMRLGPPVRAAALMAAAHGNRRVAMDAIGVAIGQLLPHAYAGTYSEGSHPGASAVLEGARGASL